MIFKLANILGVKSQSSESAPSTVLSALDPVSNISVPYRTAFGSNGVTVGLPASIGCTVGGSPDTVAITWAIGSYNSGAAGSTVAFHADAVYNIVGTPVETAEITNPNALTVTCQVTVKTPFFPLTASNKIIFDWKQMVSNTDNSYGTVNGSGGITTIKSVAPGTTGINIPSVGTAPTLSGGRGVLNGSGSWRQSVAGSSFDFMHYKPTQADLKWTVVAVGNFTDTGASLMGLCGNNGHSSSNNGVAVNIDSSGANVSLNVLITGNGANAISKGNAAMVFGSDTVVGLQVDHALAHASGKVTAFRRTSSSVVTEYTSTSTGADTLDNVPAAGTFGVGNWGSGANLMSGNLAMLVLLDGVESDSVRDTLIQNLAFYCGL